ncbi:hypothetical protein TNCV_955522 [Trichonephila clavipes]|nr:hypothetical protein TNCV_955522 [Trichonephila clavipes]
MMVANFNVEHSIIVRRLKKLGKVSELLSSKSCKCNLYRDYIDDYHQHVVTGDLDIVKDDLLRNFMEKGTGFRLMITKNKSNVMKQTIEDLDKFYLKIAIKYGMPIEAFNQFRSYVATEIRELDFTVENEIMYKDHKSSIENIQNDFVITYVDKQESDYAHSQQRHTEPVSNEKEFYREYLTRDLLGMQRSRPPHGAAWDCGGYHFCSEKGVNVKSCQVIYSQFGLAIHQNDHQARRRFVEWAQNEIAVVPDYHKRILFSDEAHFWLNGYVNKQNCRIWSEANPQVYVETPLHPKKLTVWCALWAGGILQKR